MITIFYIWGLINSLLVLRTAFINNKISDKSNAKNIILTYTSVYIWLIIGLFTDQQIWFLCYILLICVRLINPNFNHSKSKIKMFYNKLIILLHFSFIIFPIVNYFYLHIPISELFINLIK